MQLPPSFTDIRKIIHIDMDAFFASVEQRDNPQLRNRPIAVGHRGERGVICAASYEARKFGVRSAMPSLRAAALCKELIFVEPRFEAYKAVSEEMHDIFHQYTDIIEPISLDEAFLDVTENKPHIDLAVEIAKEIKRSIRSRLSLTASAGVSYNKFLAKIASDYRKPDGLCTIHPSVALDFIHKLPVEDFWGVGKVTARKMHDLGIFNGRQLGEMPLGLLRRYFGKAGEVFFLFARGIDPRPVVASRVRKSLGCETTLHHDISDYEDVMEVVSNLSEELYERLTRKNFNGSTLTLKLKFNDFSIKSKSITERTAIKSQEEILHLATTLYNALPLDGKPLRLIGLSVSRNIKTTSSLPDFQQLQINFDE